MNRILEACILDSIRMDQKRIKQLKTAYEINRVKENIKKKQKLLCQPSIR